MRIIYPDKEFTALQAELKDRPLKSIFLAGTIDNGDSSDWQNDLIKSLESSDDKLKNYLTIYNPRRHSWDNNSGEKLIEKQIKWEQDNLDNADVIAMVLQDNSKSPVSLLELGLYATSGKLVVFCTNKFYRYDNVRLTCSKYNIPLYNTTNIEYITDELINILNK